jgi:hypothetical protein
MLSELLDKSGDKQKVIGVLEEEELLTFPAGRSFNHSTSFAICLEIDIEV